VVPKCVAQSSSSTGSTSKRQWPSSSCSLSRASSALALSGKVSLSAGVRREGYAGRNITIRYRVMQVSREGKHIPRKKIAQWGQHQLSSGNHGWSVFGRRMAGKGSFGRAQWKRVCSPAFRRPDGRPSVQCRRRLLSPIAPDSATFRRQKSPPAAPILERLTGPGDAPRNLTFQRRARLITVVGGSGLRKASGFGLKIEVQTLGTPLSRRLITVALRKATSPARQAGPTGSH
jgi:hypothetical protein